MSTTTTPVIRGKRGVSALVALLLATLAGCGGGGAPTTPPSAQAWTDDGYVASGSYTLSYQAQLLQALDPLVARRYDLQPQAGRGLLTLVLSQQPGARPVEARFSVEIRTLTGELRTVALRRVEAEGAVSQLAEFAVPRREWLVFHMAAAVPQGPRLEARFRREFFTQ